VHGKPDPRRLKQLTEFVQELGIECESLESRFELQRILKEVDGKPSQHAVNYAILRSLQQAVYSPKEEGHYALASDCYCHFTSPIRRYPDLTVHRLIRAIVMKEKPINDYAALEIQGEHCSNRERRAEAAERELTKLKLLSYMSSRIGEELDAVITGVEDFGIFVQGTAIPAEGLLHTSALADDYYDYDRKQHRLTGRRSGRVFRLGDKINVRIARVDLDRRELDFRLASEPVDKDETPENPGELEFGFRERKHVPAGKKPPSRGPGRFSGKSSRRGNQEPPRGKKKRK
jgi:ribonuclease R